MAQTVKTHERRYWAVFWEHSRILKSREERRRGAYEGDGVTGRHYMIMNKGPGMTPVKPDFRTERVRVSRKGRAKWWRYQFRKRPKIKQDLNIHFEDWLKNEWWVIWRYIISFNVFLPRLKVYGRNYYSITLPSSLEQHFSGKETHRNIARLFWYELSKCERLNIPNHFLSICSRSHFTIYAPQWNL